MDPSSSPPGPASAPAGWYPVDTASQRYWDGYEWSNQIAPLAPASRSLDGLAMPDERTYCLIMHLSALVVGFIGPLIMWLIKKDESPFIDHHGKQSMNFHLTMFLAGIVSFVLIFVLIGIFMLVALGIAYLVITILAAVAANRGEYYQFPLTIRFFQ